MALTKGSASVLANNITLTASAGNTTSSAVDLTGSYDNCLYIKLTNGGTGPTIPAQVLIQTSPDNSNWYDAYGPFIGSITSSAVAAFGDIPIPIGTKWIRSVSGSNTGQDVTCRVEIAPVTAL